MPPPCEGSLAFGFCASTNGKYSISIGTNAFVGGGSGGSIAIGRDSSSYDYSIAIGTYARNYCSRSIAIGTGAVTRIENSTSIFAGMVTCTYNTWLPGFEPAVRFTQVAGATPDCTYYIFQHLQSSATKGQIPTGVIITATNFFNLLKSAGGQEYNISPWQENATINYCSSTYCSSDYCSSDYYC